MTGRHIGLCAGLQMMIGAAFGAGSAAAEDLRFFTIGAGDVSGGYFAAATAICDVINRQERGRFRCSPEATQGSLYNIEALRSGQIDFAIVQSDWQRFAYDGTVVFEAEGPMTDLRSVMSLYPEDLTVIARQAAGIIGLEGLRGQRIDIGLPASGRRGTTLALLESLGFALSDFAAVMELPTGAALDALCQGRLDATIQISGHPNAALGRVLRDSAAELVPLDSAMVAQLLAANPDYLPGSIPARDYAALSAPVETFAVTATLVTRAGMPDDMVQKLVADTLAELPLLKVSAPLFREATVATMREGGLTAPLHPGAAAAFEAAH